MTFDRKTLVIPDNTKFEEKTIITEGDVVIGDRCLLQFGIKTDGRIFVGEHVIIDGDIEALKRRKVKIKKLIENGKRQKNNPHAGG